MSRTVAVGGEQANKELDRTNGTPAKMEAPFAGQFQRSADLDQRVSGSGHDRERGTGMQLCLVKPIVGAGLLALLATVGFAQECVDPVALDRRLDQKLLDVTPGQTLIDFEAKVAKRSSDFGRTSSGERQDLFILSVEDGSRTALAPLWCTFGEDDHLRACQAQLGRAHIQLITQAALDGLRAGEPIGLVEARLCLAQARRLAPTGEIELQYSLPDPKHGLAHVHLLFDAGGRLKSKNVRRL